MRFAAAARANLGRGQRVETIGDARPEVRSSLDRAGRFLGLAALEVGVDLMLEADMAAVRAKSMALGQLFVETMEPVAARHRFTLVSPGDPAERGSQISYAHPQAYPIVQALIARGVVGDFRAPDVLRFGLTPLYTSFADVEAAVRAIAAVMDEGAWDAPEYMERAVVT